MSGFYGEDLPLARRLGLNLTVDFARKWTTLGEVLVADNDAEIKIEACAMPAQFWRFTVRREDEDEGGTETLLVKTGSGSLRKYWPMAEAIASNMLDVEVVA